MWDNDGNILYETADPSKTVPNIDALHAHDITMDLHPGEWLNLFVTIYKKSHENLHVVTIEDFTTWENKKSYLSNSGTEGSQCPKWEPLSIEEIMQHLGPYIANGLAPCPQVTMKFNTQDKDPINGNDFLANAFDRNAYRQH